MYAGSRIGATMCQTIPDEWQDIGGCSDRDITVRHGTIRNLWGGDEGYRLSSMGGRQLKQERWPTV